MKLEKLESFPPNSNPFHYDAIRMGQYVAKDICIMYMQHEENKSFVIVDMITGERAKIMLNR